MSDPAVVSKEVLLKPQLPEELVEVAGLGAVRVRGLSRAEVVTAQAPDKDRNDFETALLTFGLVDPALTETEARQWRETALSKTVNDVSSAILRLSGLLPGAAKAAKRTFRDDT